MLKMLDKEAKALSGEREFAFLWGDPLVREGKGDCYVAGLSQTSHPVWFPFPAELSKGYLLPIPPPQGPLPTKDPRAAGGAGRQVRAVVARLG